MTSTREISTLEDLRQFAAEFAAELKGGEIIGLIGDLGAGKTTFVQFLAEALGVKNAVKSPTFILLQVFVTSGEAAQRGIKQLCHVDAYRFKEERELRTIGFDDYAGERDTVCVVEWADRVPFLAQIKGYRELRFVLLPGNRREITVSQ